jgi:hypothetical protein
MLTPENLTVIRAALCYFCDELLPHGPEAYAAYLDQPLPEGFLTGQSIVQLCDRLTTCELRWARYSPETNELLVGKLLKTVPDTQTPLAAVLIPTCR